MSRAALLLIALLSLGFAPLPFPRPVKPGSAEADLKALQGEWVAAREYKDGKVGDAPAGDETYKIAYRGRTMITYFDGEERGRGEVILDISSTIRRMIFGCVFGGKRRNVFLLYRVEGDTLSICYAHGQAEVERACPTSLNPNEGIVVRVYKRKKP